MLVSVTAHGLLLPLDVYFPIASPLRLTVQIKRGPVSPEFTTLRQVWTLQCLQRQRRTPGPKAMATVSASWHHGISHAAPHRSQKPGAPGPGICKCPTQQPGQSKWSQFGHRRSVIHGLPVPFDLLAPCTRAPAPPRRQAAKAVMPRRLISYLSLWPLGCRRYQQGP